MVKLDLKGYGLKTPPRLKNAREWSLGPEHYLVTCLPDIEQNVLAQVRAFPAPQDLLLPPPVYVTDVTSVYAQFLLAGPQSRNVLRKLTSLNAAALANLACGQASVAHVPGIILRDDLADIPAFHLLVSREYGESVWDAILHAGHEFHIAPVRIEGSRISRWPRMMQLFRKERMWRSHELKSSYDVVIIGAGVHGLGIAYYLASRHGIRNIAVLDRGYLGCGNSGRNTAIIRSNYRTPEGIPFYEESVQLYERLSRELEWNLLFSQCGHLTLAHTDSAMAGLRVRAENNQVLGVDSRIIYPRRNSPAGSRRWT